MEEVKKSRFSSFNHLILINIAKYLTPAEVISSFAYLNRSCRNVGKHNALWRKFIVREAIMQHQAIHGKKKKPKKREESKEEHKGENPFSQSEDTFDQDKRENKYLSSKQIVAKNRALEALKSFFRSNDPDYFKYYVTKKTMFKGIERADVKVTSCNGHSNSITVGDSNGRHFVTGDKDRHLIYWAMEKKRKAFYFEGHSNSITGVLMYPDLHKVVSCSADRSVRIWTTEHVTGSGMPPPVPRLTRNSSSTSSTNSVGGESSSSRSPYQLYKKAPYKHGVTGIRRVDEAHALTYSRDDCKILIWDIKNDELAGSLQQADYDQMGKRMVTNGVQTVSSDSSKLFVHDIETGKLLFDFQWVNLDFTRFNQFFNPEVAQMLMCENGHTMFVGSLGVVQRFDLRKPLKHYQEFCDKYAHLPNNTAEFAVDPDTLRNRNFPFQAKHAGSSYPSAVRYIEGSNLLLIMIESSPFISVYDVRKLKDTPIYNYETSKFQSTCLDVGKNLMTQNIVSVGGMDNEVRLVDLTKSPSDQTIKKGGKLIPHIRSALTKVKFEDDFIIAGGRDGQLSVIEFVSKLKSYEPRLTKLTAK